MTEMDKLLLFSSKDNLKKMNHIQTVELIEKLEEENAELKTQIEKMKRCENCIHYIDCYDGASFDCLNKDKWELAE